MWTALHKPRSAQTPLHCLTSCSHCTTYFLQLNDFKLLGHSGLDVALHGLWFLIHTYSPILLFTQQILTVQVPCVRPMEIEQ